jgi:hypothetical protein
MQAAEIPTPISVSVLGTGGMRLLSVEQQAAIYSDVRHFIDHHYKSKFQSSDIQTLPSKMEALYGWLSVNYLKKHFQKKEATFGSIDMGGASTQIAFETKPTSKSIDYTTLQINEKKYTVFSKSFLGLGMQQALESMNTDQDASTCYPSGTPYSPSQEGNFNLVRCNYIYRELINRFNVKQQIVPVYHVPKFVAFSGAYETYHFFDVDKDLPDQEVLEQQVLNPVCSNSWHALREAYPAEPHTILASYCANAIYITQLFYEGYGIRNTQLQVRSKIDDQKINWSLGALLYRLVI